MPNLTRRDFLKLGGVAFASTVLRGPRAAANDRTPPPILYRGSALYPRIAITYDDCDLLTRLHMLQPSLLANPGARVTLFGGHD